MANMGDYADMDAENVESAEVVCPRCGSRHVAQILHGMPAFTEELQRELAEGKVVLGGCDIDIFHPTPSAAAERRRTLISRNRFCVKRDGGSCVLTLLVKRRSHRFRRLRSM